MDGTLIAEYRTDRGTVIRKWEMPDGQKIQEEIPAWMTERLNAEEKALTDRIASKITREKFGRILKTMSVEESLLWAVQMNRKMGRALTEEHLISALINLEMDL